MAVFLRVQNPGPNLSQTRQLMVRTATVFLSHENDACVLAVARVLALAHALSPSLAEGEDRGAVVLPTKTSEISYRSLQRVGGTLQGSERCAGET